MTLTLAQAEDLAARTLAAIDACAAFGETARDDYCREQVASDLAGLRDCWSLRYRDYFIDLADHAVRYEAGLRRTAALYGVK